MRIDLERPEGHDGHIEGSKSNVAVREGWMGLEMMLETMMPMMTSMLLVMVITLMWSVSLPKTFPHPCLLHVIVNIYRGL